MKRFAPFVIALALGALPNFYAFAYAPPPARLTEQAVTPSCITTQPSNLVGQYPGWGTGGKGPAVQIRNGCSVGIVVTDIQTATAQAPVKKTVSQVDALLTTFEDQVTRYKSYIFAGSDEDCKAATVKLEKIVEEEKSQEERTRRIREEDKARGFEDPLQQWRDAHPTQTDKTGLACRNVLVPVGGTLTIAVPWGTLYAISGHSDNSADTTASFDISVDGKMINPRDTNSADAVNLAESGDNRVRHDLAVRYIDLKQHYDIALRWLQAAAADGYWASQYQLAICYSNGACGVKQNIEEGYFWWVLATGNSNNWLSKKRDEAEHQLTPQQVETVKKRVVEWTNSHPPTSNK